MEIKSTIIKAQASLNYQVGAIEIEISNYTGDEFIQVEEYCISKAKEICMKLQNGTTDQTPNVEVRKEYTPRNNNNGYQQYSRKPIAEKTEVSQQNFNSNTRMTSAQEEFLKRLKYNGNWNLTKEQASDIIKELKNR